MVDTEFHNAEWLITFALGLPVLAVVAGKRWRHAQAALPWRAILCVIAACIFTPWIVSENFEGAVAVDIFPAARVLLYALAGAFGREPGALAAGIRYGLFPILLASLAMIAIWSTIINVRKERGRC